MARASSAANYRQTPYDECVEHCLELFPGNQEALIACIQGCGMVHGGLFTAPSTVGVASQIETQAWEMGKEGLLKELRVAARQAYASLPDESELRILNATGQRVLGEFRRLIETALQTSDWSVDKLADFAGEVACARLVADVIVLHMQNNDNSPGTGKTCAGQCLDEYNKCMKEHNCKDDSWICICCSPCSLQYMGCISACVLSFSSAGGGIFAA